MTDSKKKDEFVLPVIVPMDPIPANSNPFHHDLYHMGCNVSGPWMAMFTEHAGSKQEHNMSDEEKEAKERGETVWNPDPSYIIMINQKTGHRFKMVFKFDRDDGDMMNAILKQRQEAGHL